MKSISYSTTFPLRCSGRPSLFHFESTQVIFETLSKFLVLHYVGCTSVKLRLLTIMYIKDNSLTKTLVDWNCTVYKFKSCYAYLKLVYFFKYWNILIKHLEILFINNSSSSVEYGLKFYHNWFYSILCSSGFWSHKWLVWFIGAWNKYAADYFVIIAHTEMALTYRQVTS